MEYGSLNQGRDLMGRKAMTQTVQCVTDGHGMTLIVRDWFIVLWFWLDDWCFGSAFGGYRFALRMHGV